MPIRKESKETVTYPPSKRKAPPFIPQRPSKLSRIPTSESESSDHTSTVSKAVATSSTTSKKKTAPTAKISNPSTTKSMAKSAEFISDISDDSDSFEDLPDDTLTAQVSKMSRCNPAPPATTLPPDTELREADTEALPPDIDQEATISQPLLLRLMHESFVSKETKIDKHAIVVLQKYMDVFVRETIARAVLSKQDDIDNGQASQSDSGWLDRRDLDKVAGGMLLDF